MSVEFIQLAMILPPVFLIIIILVLQQRTMPIEKIQKLLISQMKGEDIINFSLVTMVKEKEIRKPFSPVFT